MMMMMMMIAHSGPKWVIPTQNWHIRLLQSSPMLMVWFVWIMYVFDKASDDKMAMTSGGVSHGLRS